MGRGRLTERDLRAMGADLSRCEVLGVNADAIPGGAPAPPKRSKYGNRKTEAGGIVFDSKREAEHWVKLRALEAAGRVRNLRRQVRVMIHSPRDGKPVVAWVADMVYDDDAGTHWIDCKGVRTEAYRIKKRLVAAFLGIDIEEV